MKELLKEGKRRLDEYSQKLSDKSNVNNLF